MNARKQLGRWAALFALSLPLAWLFYWLNIPAAFLLGPLIAGIIFGVSDSRLRLPRSFFVVGQATIGCLVASTLSASILVTVLDDWAVMLLVLSTTVLAGALVGWTMTRLRVLPGNTAAWGSSPGAASAMIAMAAEYGADMRLVAFMQYLRMVIVVLSATLVSRLLLGAAGGMPAPMDLTSLFGGTALSFVETLAVGAGGAMLGQKLRIPAGAVVMPMAIGAVAQSAGWISIALPPWLLAIVYGLLGWYVGLSFTRDVLVYGLRALPKLVLATLMLIGLCALSAWMLMALLHVDALTAYLATSPGGLDSVAIIAVATKANAPFVLAMQTMRLFIVILTGPPIAKLISKYG